MSLTLSGSGTIGGLVAGGLPDATVTNAELVTMDGAKLTGALPAIDGSALTGTGLGVGQTWQDVTSSRSSGVTYTNSTGKPIFVSLTGYSYHMAIERVFVDGVLVGEQYIDTGNSGELMRSAISFVVPFNSTYLFTAGGGNYAIDAWSELR